MHPPHEARVQVARTVGKHVMEECLVHVLQWGGLHGQGGVEAGPDRVRHGLPYGTRPQALEMIEHVVQHAVGLEASLWPIVGIKAGGRLFHIRHVNHLEGQRPGRSFDSS